MNDDKIISFADNKLVIKKEQEIKWAKFTVDSKGNKTILKVWQNLESVLNYHNLKPRLNQINKEIEWNSEKFKKLSNNGALEDIRSLQIEEGLGMSREDMKSGIKRIAEKEKFNPFLDILKANENDDKSTLVKLMSCLEIQDDFKEHREFYSKLFLKWCLNVVKMAHNTKEKSYAAQGILILQGGQGTFKSTFFKQLFPGELRKMFKGETSVDPDNKDSVIAITKYIVSELAEMDSMFKQDQAKLKRFVTATDDEYRAPYDAMSEVHPRLTSFCGTINKTDFLKDETGSRRYWIIPVTRNNHTKQAEIDMIKFWGYIYNLYKNNTFSDFLNVDELKYLSEINKDFNAESDVSILLKEKLDFDSDKSTWKVRQLKDLALLLNVKETKKIKIELIKIGIEYKKYRVGNKTKSGVLVPHFDLSQQC